MMGIARVSGFLGLVTSALAATVQVDLQPCILAPSSIVSPCPRPIPVLYSGLRTNLVTCVSCSLLFSVLTPTAKHVAYPARMSSQGRPARCGGSSLLSCRARSGVSICRAVVGGRVSFFCNCSPDTRVTIHRIFRVQLDQTLPLF